MNTFVDVSLTERARSFAKLITELPTAANREMQINAIQNEGRQEKWVDVESMMYPPVPVCQEYLDAVNAVISAENHLKELLIKEGLLNE